MDLLELAGKVAPIVAAAAAVVAATLGYLNRRKVQRLEVKVDGRLEQLLQRTDSSARAEGVTQGEQDQRARTAAPQP